MLRNRDGQVPKRHHPLGSLSYFSEIVKYMHLIVKITNCMIILDY